MQPRNQQDIGNIGLFTIQNSTVPVLSLPLWFAGVLTFKSHGGFNRTVPNKPSIAPRHIQTAGVRTKIESQRHSSRSLQETPSSLPRPGFSSQRRWQQQQQWRERPGPPIERAPRWLPIRRRLQGSQYAST